jgi:hypothetical protein
MVKGADKADVLELGINCHISEFFLLTLNYEHAEFDDESAVFAQLRFEF